MNIEAHGSDWGRPYPSFALFDELKVALPAVPHPTFKVLFAEWCFADDDGFAWPTRALIAEVTGLSPQQVTKAWAWLREAGLIRLVEPGSKNRKRSSCYQVFPERQVPQRHLLQVPQQVPERHTKTQKTHSSPSESANRQPDYLFEAVVEACRLGDWKTLTRAERGPLNRAVRELREVGATPEEVRVRSRRYRQTWPRIELTPSALVANWSRFNGDRPADEDGTVLDKWGRPHTPHIR